MRIIEPSVEIMRTGLENYPITPEQFIEKVGRTCYKSEDKITDTSAAKFVTNLIKNGHEAMIEHWSLVFKTDKDTYDRVKSDWDRLLHVVSIPIRDQLRPYIRFTSCELDEGDARYIISGNMRAWRDYAKTCVSDFGLIPDYMYDMVKTHPLFFPEYQDYIFETSNDHKLIQISISELNNVERKVHQDVTVKFICDRGVSHEMVRHRVASFAQESTRYCNYSKDKFGSELTVIRPSWCNIGDDIYDIWCCKCMEAESSYFLLLACGATPQEARSVLPNSLKTEIIVTMNLDGWDHFFGLRCSKSAHPDMREVAMMALQMFEIEGI